MEIQAYIEQIDWQIVKLSAFWVFGCVAIIGALILLFTKNVLYGAYSLLLSFLGVAGIFVFAGADFLALSQIMIYVGGVLILLIFGIMLTRKSKDEKGNQILVSHDNHFGAFIVAVSLALILGWVIFNANFQIIKKISTEVSAVKKIGINLITNYVFGFEVIGLLLLVAVVGASYIALKEKKV